MADLEHCWHSVSGMTLPMLPPIRPVRCCWCGVDGTVQTFEEGQLAGHGPEIPGWKSYYKPTGPCPNEQRDEVGAK